MHQKEDKDQDPNQDLEQVTNLDIMANFNFYYPEYNATKIIKKMHIKRIQKKVNAHLKIK